MTIARDVLRDHLRYAARRPGGLPLLDEPTARPSSAYDAGSEENNEDGAFIPGPPFGCCGGRATDGAEGFVHIHSGVHGIADLAPEVYDWRNPTAMIRVTRIK